MGESCAICGDSGSVTLVDSWFCDECAPSALRIGGLTADGFVRLAPQIAALSETDPDGVVRIVQRTLESGNALVSQFREARSHVENEMREGRRIRRTVLDVLDEHVSELAIERWWAGSAIMAPEFDNPFLGRDLGDMASLGDVLRSVGVDERGGPKNGAFLRSFDLVRDQKEIERLITEPYCARVDHVQWSAFILGLLRLRELATYAFDGREPLESFTEAEKNVFWNLEHPQRRTLRRVISQLADVGQRLIASANRAEELFPIWLMYPMPPRIGSYLRLIRKAYESGQGSAAVVLCRSALERAVSSVEERLQIQLETSMRRRLDALRKHGALTKQAFDDAWQVWLRGNKVVHEDPELVADVLGTIRLLMQVLVVLRPHLD